MNLLRRVAGDDALDELIAVLGDGTARELARQFGGTTLYVPLTIGDHHPVCAAIGREGADRLATWTGGTTIAVPKQAERRSRVLALGAGTMTQAQIARETGYSQRHVRRLLREKDDARQPGLFDNI